MQSEIDGHSARISVARVPAHESLARPIFAQDIQNLLTHLPDLQIIDIRESCDYARSRFPAAHNIPMPDFATLSNEILRNPSTPYLLYCYSGYTASVYGSYLVEMGADNVYFFDESFEILMQAADQNP